MAAGKERSALFKFFYVILLVITFPIYMILFILKHPIAVIIFLLMVAGALAYYPYSLGVKPDEILSWYNAKYVELKKDAVARAEEKGVTQFVPQGIVDDVKKMREDEIEAQQPKSENYNAGVVRDEKSEETKVNLKKRGGFKKVSVEEGKKEEDQSTVEDINTETGEAPIIDEESHTEKENVLPETEISNEKETLSGGLATILKNKDDTGAISEENEDTSLNKETTDTDEEIVHLPETSEDKATDTKENIDEEKSDLDL